MSQQQQQTQLIDTNNNQNHNQSGCLNRLNDKLMSYTVVPIDKEAPTPNCWYHGRLSRTESEERLRKANKERCFLIRESYSRPGSFVLSYLSLDGVINHYKITALYGDYYIGGRQFDRLETLISYYMYYSELKKGEKLLNPVEPPKVCKIERDCVAIKSHIKLADSDELSYNKGDYIKVYHSIGEGEWVWAQLVKMQQFGLVNVDSVTDIDDSKLHEYESWYFDKVTKEEAAEILSNAGHCSFLVRPSEQSPGDFTLFFNVNNYVHRYRITRSGKLFHIGGRNFDSIPAIIERYKYEDLVDGFKLNLNQQLRPNKAQNETTTNTTSTLLPPIITQPAITSTLAAEQQQRHNDLTAKSIDKLFKQHDIDSKVHLQVGRTLSDNTIRTNHEQHQLQLQQQQHTNDYVTIAIRSTIVATANDNKQQQIHLLSPSNSTKRNSIGPDILNRKTDQVAIKGYLQKYNEKTKKWKPYWFVLNQTERQLYYFANEKRIKEKGLIDLSYGFYYPVDDSLFDKLFCFQIIIHSLDGNCSLNTYYLSSDNELLFKEWTTKIRLLCNQTQLNKKIQIKTTKSTNNYHPHQYYQPPSSNNNSSNNKLPTLLPPLTSKSSLNTRGASPPTSTNTNTTKYRNDSDDDLIDITNTNDTDTDEQQQQQPHQQENEKNYFLDRSLHIEIKEARNIFYLLNQNKQQNTSSNSNSNTNIINLMYLNESSTSSTNSNSSNTNNNHVNGYNNNSSSNNNNNSSNQIAINSKEFSNLCYYCLIMFNRDAYVASTKLSSNSTTTKSLNTINEDTIWDEKFNFGDVPLDISTIRILIFSTKRSSLNNFLSTTAATQPTQLSSSNGGNIITNSLTFIQQSTSSSSSINLSSSLNANSNSYKCKSKESNLIGQLTIKLSDLINKGLNEDWYKLDNHSYNGSTSTGGGTCSIRVKIRFNEDKILYNLNDYARLNTFLLTSIRYLSTVYDCVCPSNERSEFVQNLIKFYTNNSTKTNMIDILKSYLDYEIDRCIDINTLFRSTTLTTSLMDYYMRSKTEVYLRKAIYEPLYSIIKSSQRNQESYELDPLKLYNQYHITTTTGHLNKILENNLNNFKQALSKLLNSICVQSIDTFPIELIYLFSHIRKRVCEKWPNDRNVRTYSISSFIFLRLICPALLNITINNLNVNQFNMFNSTNSSGTTGLFSISNTLNSTRSSITSASFKLHTSNNQNQIKHNLINERHIKLLTKAIQTLANLTECKESFMMPLTEFLNQNRKLIIEYIDTISAYNPVKHKIDSISNTTTSDSSSSSQQDDESCCKMGVCKNLAVLQRLFNSFMSQNQSTNQTNDDKNSNDNDFSESNKQLIDILNEVNKKIDYL